MKHKFTFKVCINYITIKLFSVKKDVNQNLGYIIKWGETKIVHLKHNSIFNEDTCKVNINRLQIKIYLHTNTKRSKCDESIIVFSDLHGDTYLTSFVININFQNHKKYISQHIYNTSLFHPTIVPPNNISNISNVIYVKLIQYNGI
jgi:hypothetical protein